VPVKAVAASPPPIADDKAPPKPGGGWREGVPSSRTKRNDKNRTARMASGSGVVGMHKCWGDPRRRFAPTTPGVSVVDAHSPRGLDFHSQALLGPPKYAHEWPVKAARLGCRNVRGTPGVGLHPPHPVVASWTHSVRVVWTYISRYC